MSPTGQPEPLPHQTILPGELSQAELIGDETIRGAAEALAGKGRLLPGELSQAEPVSGANSESDVVPVRTLAVCGEATVTSWSEEEAARHTILPGELSEAESLFDEPPPGA